MHDALASDPGEPVFAPQPATGEDVARWAAATRRSTENAIALLADRLTALPEEIAADAAAIVERRSSFTDTVAEQAAALAHDAGEKIRHHGDYHLGQVLRAPDGTYMIIDFEGEPARPLAERRERASALRDVAGMLRSFAYAAATLATEQRARGSDAADLDARAARWEQEVRAAFLRGYMREPLPGYLPAAREHVDALLSLFETEKVFYELAYELNNRPDWDWIPIQGIGRLLSAHATHSDARR
jgi:maltose alpha-D-glucosyltransferase/alpha-amylase